MSKKIIEIISDSISNMNPMLSQPISLEKGENTELFGKNGLLDSMSLVALIVDLEERLENAFDQPFLLASEKAMSQRRSPFMTIKTLSDYIESLFEEAQKNAA